jgi:hypothetical protein
MRATILTWSAISGLILGLFAGTLLFATLLLGGELAPSVVPRLAGRARVVVSVISFVVVPVAGAILGWLEGRLKLQ